jgi:TolB-like protein
VATSVLPLYDTPAWFLRAFVLIVSLGFPIALVMAWMLEVTPEGIKADVPTAGSKRMFAIAAVLAALALGWDFRGDLPPARAPAGQLRLAVLPLSNFSPDPDNAFYADGLHDDILTSLSRLHGVEVISRTSMQTFKGSTLTLSEIAAKLGATQVLEGSVRRETDRVRLTVQLIAACLRIWNDESLALQLTPQVRAPGADPTVRAVHRARGAIPGRPEAIRRCAR